MTTVERTPPLARDHDESPFRSTAPWPTAGQQHYQNLNTTPNCNTYIITLTAVNYHHADDDAFQVPTVAVQEGRADDDCFEIPAVAVQEEADGMEQRWRRAALHSY